jgi:transposase IS4-like protein
MSCHRVTAAGANSRAGQRITSARAAAGIRLEALDEFISPQAVEEAVRSCGRRDTRWCASLPASAVVYFVPAMCLHFSESYAEILRKLTVACAGRSTQVPCGWQAPPLSPKPARSWGLSH